MEYNIKSNKYKLKLNLNLNLNSFIGGEILRQKAHRNLLANVSSKPIDISPIINSWVKQNNTTDVWYVNLTTKESVWKVPPNSWIKNEIYVNPTTNKTLDKAPNNNIWIEKDNGSEKWYVNLHAGNLSWTLPPNAWLKKVIYTNSSDKSQWKEKQDDNDVWYTNNITKETVWELPQDIILPDPVIPSFINEDFEIYNYQGAGHSYDIWPVISGYYNSFGKKISIVGRNDKSKLFKIIPKNIDEDIEPILGNGTYTAVYVLEDLNDKINDEGYIYILRIYIRDNNYSDRNMFDYEKVEDEFRIFKEYMAKIYFYGSLYDPNGRLLSKNYLPFDINITKIYNTLSSNKVRELTNKQKIKFLLQNINMLDILASNGYIHCDYKLDNVAYENPDEMNVILIDYDITTLQQLVPTNKLISFYDNKVYTMYVSSTYPPRYIKNDLPLKNPINVFYKLPLYQWDKYSIGGLIDIIERLEIQYNFEKIKLPPILSNGKILVLMSQDIIHYLKLNDTTYDTIPTYSELYNIFSYLYENNLVA